MYYDVLVEMGTSEEDSVFISKNCNLLIWLFIYLGYDEVTY